MTKIKFPPKILELFHKIGFPLLRLVFPYAVVISYTFLLIETYTYPGFFRHLIFLDARWIAGLTIALGGVIALTWVKGTNILARVILDQNRLITPAIALIYALLMLTELNHFPNYVFSSFHLHPRVFAWMLVFNFSLLVIDFISLYNQKILKFLHQKKQPINYVLLVFVLLLGYYLLKNISLVAQSTLEYYSYLVTHPFANYKEKLTYKVSDYPYYAFVNELTPPDATILVPPQESPWLTSGNVGYIRNFLYPRKLLQGTYQTAPIPSGTQYVLIARGEWPVNDLERYGWPKATISAQHIWYFDQNTRQHFEADTKTFDPNAPENKERWGLIQLQGVK